MRLAWEGGWSSSGRLLLFSTNQLVTLFPESRVQPDYNSGCNDLSIGCKIKPQHAGIVTGSIGLQASTELGYFEPIIFLLIYL